MYTTILVCSLSNFLINEHDDDDDDAVVFVVILISAFNSL